MDESESKLEATLALLKRKSFIVKDDTCLQKLFYYIAKYWDINDTLATELMDNDKTGIQDLISTVTLSPDDFDPAVIALCVKLCGIPALADQYNDTVLSSLKSVHSHRMLDNLTVAVSFYHTLINLIPSHIGKLREVLPWNAIVQHALQSLREERSIYLTKEISQFLTSYLNAASDLESPSYSDQSIVKNIITVVKSCVKSTKGCQCSPAEARLMNLYVNVVVPCLEEFVSVCGKEEMTNQMLLLLRCCPLDLVPVITESLLKLMPREDASEEIKDPQLQTVIMDIAEADLIKAQKTAIIVLSAACHHRNETAYRNLFTYPLQVICGSEDTMSRIPTGILRQMDTKSTCINITCQSIQGIVSFKGKVDNFADLMLNVFESVVLDSPVSRTKYNAHIFRNRKVLLKCLDVLVQDSEILQCEQALRCLEALLKSHNSHLIFSKCLDCMKRCFPAMLKKRSDGSESLGSLMVSITTCLQLQLCSMQWEVRDSSLNFIKSILMNHSDSEICSWIKDNRFLLYIHQGLADSESYVRASAISCLSYVLKDNMYRDAIFKEVDTNMDTVLDKIIETITNEAEAFPRRAATMLVLECWETFRQHSLQNKVYSVFSSVVPNDFDWEVKLGAVQFWDQCIMSIVKSYTNSEMSPEMKNPANEVSDGFAMEFKEQTDNIKIKGLITLLNLSKDHDDSVAEKSLESLIKMCKTLQDHSIAVNKFWSLSSEESQSILSQFQSRDFSSELELLQKSKDERREYLCLLDDILSYHDENNTEEEVTLDCY